MTSPDSTHYVLDAAPALSREDAEEYTQALEQSLSGGWRQTLLAVRLKVPESLGLTVPEWQQRIGGYVRLAVPERREAVAELTEQGMSTREIGDVLGVDNKTVHNDRHTVEDSTEQEPIPAGEQDPLVENSTEQKTVDNQPEPEAPESKPVEPLTPGWHELGDHLLYCGDSTDSEFIEACGSAAFAFADPPYNAGKADWDRDFVWDHDYLADAAAIVAVTPGIASLAGFLAKTAMPYQWSMAAEITNGMTAGPLRFANWICVTLFAHGSIYRKSKDHYRIPAATGDDKGGSHPSRKPLRLVTHLIGLFTSKGDTVIDPFLGSGTTLLAAQLEGRRCVGAEIDPVHCAEIVARYRASIR